MFLISCLWMHTTFYFDTFDLIAPFIPYFSATNAWSSGLATVPLRLIPILANVLTWQVLVMNGYLQANLTDLMGLLFLPVKCFTIVGILGSSIPR